MYGLLNFVGILGFITFCVMVAVGVNVNVPDIIAWIQANAGVLLSLEFWLGCTILVATLIVKGES